MLSSIIQFSTILLSLTTTGGVLIHDTKMDKLASSLSMPLITSYYDAATKFSQLATADLHPHVERHSLSQAVNDFNLQQPRIQPRASEDRRHLMQKHVSRGHHAFDNYNLPLV
jgi:hypothetical protein